jgi:hypothetical protein
MTTGTLSLVNPTNAPQSQSTGDGNINHFDSLLNRTDAPRMPLKDMRGVVYEGLKAWLPWRIRRDI